MNVERHLLRGIDDCAGETPQVEHSEACPWASVTFTGQRLLISLRLSPGAADRLAAALPEHEFAIPRHVVADIRLAKRSDHADGALVRVEALLIEAA